jgi:hypothetical protein
VLSNRYRMASTRRIWQAGRGVSAPRVACDAYGRRQTTILKFGKRSRTRKQRRPRFVIPFGDEKKKLWNEQSNMVAA